MKNYEMFTAEGNQLVARIAAAGEQLAAADGVESAWEFCYRELHKLAAADGFGEATDTAVREAVYEAVVSS